MLTMSQSKKRQIKQERMKKTWRGANGGKSGDSVMEGRMAHLAIRHYSLNMGAGKKLGAKRTTA